MICGLPWPGHLDLESIITHELGAMAQNTLAGAVRALAGFALLLY